MATATYTKAGSKATTAAKLPKEVFGLEVTDHQLLNLAYNAYLANARTNNAVTKLRGEVRGGGRKPWKQKGTGRARAGSIRSPLWRGGGITFGPTGIENYKKKISIGAKRKATAQALSLSAAADKVSIIEKFEIKDGKTKLAAKLLTKLGVTRRTLIVVVDKNEEIKRATDNLVATRLVTAKYMNVYDIMNADSIIIEKDAIAIIQEWLTGGKK